ncbi:O-methyltransferase [Actinomadura mexicana]|uniref:Caffeoyl-CoA O-methyltransferase n=1 Tax=Actinomadura mexicana TaxID=134959 RepID=A0A239EEX1_9ACTN|nr:class I SAM-dependent methyltransferase [Actinomadura mexicana]SNS43205.1 caffeoyl-CoA O-methyltransferase [Actinomadura mexicana]
MNIIDPAVGDYLLAHCPPPDDVLKELAAETEATAPDMHVTHYEGELLGMLVRMAGARNAVSVGVFTGYSSLCIVRSMPAGGRLLACEIDRRWTDIAEKYWKKAGVADRIDLRVAPAIETLRALPADPVLDFGYIGADKANHRLYYEELLARLRPGGLLLLGDALRGGHVVDPACDAADVEAVRELNDAVVHDDRVDAVILPAGDGALIVRKR